MTLTNMPLKPDLKTRLKKIISKENITAAAAVCYDLFDADLSNADKKARLTEFLLTNAETLDDAVEIVPQFGPVLAALVDSEAVDAVEAKLIDSAAEFIVYTLKGIRGNG